MFNFLAVLIYICMVAMIIIPIIVMIIEIWKPKSCDESVDDYDESSINTTQEIHSGNNILNDNYNNPKDVHPDNYFDTKLTIRKADKKYKCTYLEGYCCAYNNENNECSCPQITCDFMKEFDTE